MNRVFQKKPAPASVRSASPARMRKLKLIEPFGIVRARRLRRERLWRFALGMALIGLIMALGGRIGI